jgi:hypothetical protein
VNIRVKISKKQLLRLFIFVIFLGFTFILDNYLEKKGSIEIVGNTQKSHAGEPRIVCFFQSTITFSTKVVMQKISIRKFVRQLHNKLIQKYHQLKNYQLLKCEVENFNKPVILTSHFLGLRNYFHSSSDDVPYNS